MSQRTKPERTPLLGPGFHTLTMEQLHDLAVAPFEIRHIRQELFDKLQCLVQTLQSNDVLCDLWLDGSFLTEDPDPGDIDVAIKVDDEVMQSLTDHQDDLLMSISRDDEAFVEGLDTFVFAGYWIGHPYYGSDVDEGYSRDVPSWGWQFGKGRDDWLKGIVVVPVGENDVGLRLRS